MRLESHEIRVIRDAARAVFGRGVTVRVFGSRVDDECRGGDLDLFLEVDPGEATFDNEMAFRSRIERPLDELKVDVLLHERGRPLSPIERIAVREGEVL